MYKFKVGDLVCWRPDGRSRSSRGIVVGVVRLDRYRVQWFTVKPHTRIHRVCDLAKLEVQGG